MPSADHVLGDAAHRQSKRVLSFRQWCELNGFSESTGRRILQGGSGPQVTELSERRIGIREDHNAEWQNSRVRRNVA